MSEDFSDTPAPATLTKPDLLAALDAQIKFVSDAQRNEGWTRWAIWGALAAFLWHGTELVTRPEFDLSRSVLVAFVVFIIWVVLESLIGFISPLSRVGASAPVRFHMWTDLVSVIRPGVIASALRQVLIIIALAVFQYPGLWPLWIYSVLSLLGDLVVFAPALKHFSFPTKIGMRAVLNFAVLVPLAWLVFAGVHVGWLIQKDLQNYTLADVHFALLLNAGAYLLIRLATATTSGHFLSELTELRQHLAFERIAAPDAMRQAERLLSGLKLADVINPSVELVFKESEELAQMLKQSNEFLAQLRALVSVDTEQPHGLPRDDSILADALRRFDKLDVEAKRLDTKLKSVGSARSRFQIRVLVVAIYSRESVPELQSPIQKVQDAFKQASQGVKDFHQQLAALKTKIGGSRH